MHGSQRVSDEDAIGPRQSSAHTTGVIEGSTRCSSDRRSTPGRLQTSSNARGSFHSMRSMASWWKTGTLIEEVRGVARWWPTLQHRSVRQASGRAGGRPHVVAAEPPLCPITAKRPCLSAPTVKDGSALTDTGVLGPWVSAWTMAMRTTYSCCSNITRIDSTRSRWACAHEWWRAVLARPSTENIDQRSSIDVRLSPMAQAARDRTTLGGGAAAEQPANARPTCGRSSLLTAPQRSERRGSHSLHETVRQPRTFTSSRTEELGLRQSPQPAPPATIGGPLAVTQFDINGAGYRW